MGNAAMGASLPVADKARLSDLVARIGEPRTVKTIGIPRQTLARALAGLGLRRGTIALIQQRLGSLEERV